MISVIVDILVGLGSPAIAAFAVYLSYRFSMRRDKSAKLDEIKLQAIEEILQAIGYIRRDCERDLRNIHSDIEEDPEIQSVIKSFHSAVDGRGWLLSQDAVKALRDVFDVPNEVTSFEASLMIVISGCDRAEKIVSEEARKAFSDN